MTFNMLVNAEEQEVTVDLSTRLVETENRALTIYPNPATDKLRVRGLNGVAIARIYNVHGQEVFSGRLEGDKNEVEVSDLTTGVYMMRLEMGEETVVRRFIKK